jgi:hypothetical protein
MIDIFKRHQVQVPRRAGHTWKDIAALRGVAVRTARRIAVETDVSKFDYLEMCGGFSNDRSLDLIHHLNNL